MSLAAHTRIFVGCKWGVVGERSVFIRSCQVASKVAAPIYTPTINVWSDSQCSKFSRTLVIVSHFNFSHSGEV